MPMVKSTNAIGIAVLLHAVEQSPTALMKIMYTQIKMAQVLRFFSWFGLSVIFIEYFKSLINICSMCKRYAGPGIIDIRMTIPHDMVVCTVSAGDISRRVARTNIMSQAENGIYFLTQNDK